MRVDLYEDGSRPWWARLGIGFITRWTGAVPGPVLVVTHEPELFHREFMGYTLRSMHGSGGWSKGEAELFGSFVSNLNSCHF